VLIGYARAILPQSLDEQARALAEHGCTQVFTDRRAGSSVVRPALEQALTALSPGGVLIVTRLEVLAHDHRDLMQAVMSLRRRKLDLVAIEQGVDTREADDALFPALALLARFQLDVRQARKTEQAAEPAPKGRRRAISDDDWSDIRHRIEDGELTVEEAAEELEVDPATVQRRLKQEA